MRLLALSIVLCLLSVSLVSARPHFRIHVFKNDKMAGYGYDILNNGKPFIHQAFIPAVAGNAPFQTKKQARSVARLVRKKIKQGIMPPTVSIAELQALNIIPK